MGKIIQLALAGFSSQAIGKLLTGAGIGLASSAFIITFLNYYLNKSLGQLNSLPGDVLGLAALSGVDVGISMIIGAVIARVTLNSSFLKLIKK